MVSIPLSLLRDRAAKLSDHLNVELEPASPGLRIRGTAKALGAPISFSARVDAEGICIEGQRRTIRLTLTEVDLSTTDDAPGPLADAIRQGMIDTDHPATLLANTGSLPDFIVEAEGRCIVIDLMRIPLLERNALLGAVIAAATSYLCVNQIRVNRDAIKLGLGVLPGGVREAALSTARAALTPAVRYLWPSGGPR